MIAISAHYIYPVASKPLKNGIIIIDENTKKIVKIIDTHGHLEEGERLKFYNGIITPAFVNAHCHLELSHLHRKIPQHIGLKDFVKYVPSLREIDENTIFEAIKNADKQMKINGIAAVGDISNTNHTIAIKQQSSIFYHSFIECFGSDPAIAQQRITEITALYKEFLAANLTSSISPHALYSISEPLFNLLGNAMNKHQVSSIHHQEAVWESSHKQFETALKQMYHYFSTNYSTLLVHNTHSKLEDIQERLAKLSSVCFVLCPNSNLYIANELHDVKMFADNKLNVALGTDSLASNETLSILAEIKTIHKHFPDIEFETLLSWASLNGATALNINNLLGSIEVHKQASLNLLSPFDFDKKHILEQTEVYPISF